MSESIPAEVFIDTDYDGDFASVSAQAGNVTTSLIGGEDPSQDVNTFFILISGYLVFFMHCGFAMLSVGAVRSKNAKNILLKILIDACLGAVAFYLLGFGFAYGGTFDDSGDSNGFIGYSGFALNGVPKVQWYNWFFQFAFAVTTATIVSGAIAERARFEGYLAYAIFLTTWVYPVVVHWIWSADGWASAARADGSRLLDVGVIDFAGCAPVHMIGGLSGLAGAWIVGPRIGRFTKDGEAADMPGHNASFALLGVFVLWFGWYGFNPGSALAILDSSTIAALAAVNTTMSAAAGTLSTLVVLMVIEYRATGRVVWDLIGAANGTLAGLVGITAACSVVEPWAALIIGATSGVVYVGASNLVLHVLMIDDPLDAVAVHAFCGAWGLLMSGAFAHEPNVRAVYGDGVASAGHGFFLTGGNGRMLGTAVIIILSTAAWTLAHMVPFFLTLRHFGVLRVSKEDELAGLDMAHHGGAAYAWRDTARYDGPAYFNTEASKHGGASFHRSNNGSVRNWNGIAAAGNAVGGAARKSINGNIALLSEGVSHHSHKGNNSAAAARPDSDPDIVWTTVRELSREGSGELPLRVAGLESQNAALELQLSRLAARVEGAAAAMRL